MTDAPTEAATRWRKKPVVIDATQWFKNGDHPLDYSKDHDGFEGTKLRVYTAAERREKSWEGDVVRYFRRPDVRGDWGCQHCRYTMHEHGWIDTLEGGHTVCPGDWIITGVKGEHYPCKPDIFAATYEPESRLTAPAAVGDAPEDSSDLRMSAYYYSFEPTGIRLIDEILSAVARAGKAYHHTESWNDDSPSVVDGIQDAANKAAEVVRKLRSAPGERVTRERLDRIMRDCGVPKLEGAIAVDAILALFAGRTG